MGAGMCALIKLLLILGPQGLNTTQFGLNERPMTIDFRALYPIYL